MNMGKILITGATVTPAGTRSSNCCKKHQVRALVHLIDAADTPARAEEGWAAQGRMAYVERGEGWPVVLLHGNPTSSYLWRNVPRISSDADG